MTDDQATRRPIRVILDASAIVAFTRESIHVGEVIAEIDDELGAAALPLPALVEAVHAVTDTDRLDILLEHRATVVIADEPADWRALATTYDIVGRIDAASAVLAAIDNDCDVPTRQPGCTRAWPAAGRSSRSRSSQARRARAGLGHIHTLAQFGERPTLDFSTRNAPSAAGRACTVPKLDAWTLTWGFADRVRLRAGTG